MSGWIETLQDNGWARVTRSDKQASLKSVIAYIKPSRIEYRFLRPCSQSEARPNSLSAQFGRGLLPLHTDNVTDSIPPRYLLLAAPPTRTTKTLVADPLRCPQLRLSDARQALFQLRAPGLIASVRFLSETRSKRYIRFNQQVMVPKNTAAHAVCSALKEMLNWADVVDWEDTRLLIIDNHRVVHGRDNVNFGEESYVRRYTIW